MNEQRMVISFSNGTTVEFSVKSMEALSQHHTLGCIEVACGELISQNNALMSSGADD